MVVVPRCGLGPRPPKGRGLFIFYDLGEEVVSMDDDDDNDWNNLVSIQIVSEQITTIERILSYANAHDCNTDCSTLHADR